MKSGDGVHTTNYADTLILVSPDTKVRAGKVPAAEDSVAGRQYAMIAGSPYAHTSDDVIFKVHADRAGIPEDERAAARADFFSRGQACLRASPLVKTHGWGVHSDAHGRVALVAMESAQYAGMAADTRLAKAEGMRSKRADRP